MKKLTIRINRIYKWDESDLSPTQKKFLDFHQHHIYCKHLKDFKPQEHERTILILADNFGKVHKGTIELIPFNYILIVDPEMDLYNCSIIDGKKVFQFPLEPVIFLQIAQGEKIKIDSLFLSNKNESLFDFLLEMCYPLMNKNEFTFITDASPEYQSTKTPFENRIKTLPYEVFHQIKQKEFKQFDLFCFMTKTNVSKSYTINGKTITTIHNTYWSDIDCKLDAVFTPLDEWIDYILRLYQQDIYDFNGVYKSADNKVYDLKKMEHLNKLINRCEYKIVGFTLNPRIKEQVFQIMMSENFVQEIFIYGFLEEGNII